MLGDEWDVFLCLDSNFRGSVWLLWFGSHEPPPPNHGGGGGWSYVVVVILFGHLSL